MTQQPPYENGTKVLYGAFYLTGPMSTNLDQEATIRGFTHLNDSLYYVLAGHSESGNDMLFIRSHDQVRVDTTLAQYIVKYIHEEMHRFTSDVFDIHLPSYQHQFNHWIADAVDAYEGGAR